MRLQTNCVNLEGQWQNMRVTVQNASADGPYQNDQVLYDCRRTTKILQLRFLEGSCLQHSPTGQAARIGLTGRRRAGSDRICFASPFMDGRAMRDRF